MIADAPTFSAAWASLVAHIPADAIIVAYNAPFDRAFLSHSVARCHCGIPPWMHHDAHWLDVLVWARIVDPYARGTGRFKLGNVAGRLGVAPGAAHRAAGDAETTLGVLRAIDRTKPLPDDFAALIFTQRIAAARDEASFFEWLSAQPPRPKAGS